MSEAWESYMSREWQEFWEQMAKDAGWEDEKVEGDMSHLIDP